VRKVSYWHSIMKRFHVNVGARALAQRNSVPALLYLFTSATFTSAGVSGQTGPTLAQCKTAYSTAGYSWAATYLDMTTQGYQLWTVPKTGSYTVRAAGAAADAADVTYSKGAIIQTTLSLKVGDKLQILVGQQGLRYYPYDSGGGGGSFVASGSTPATGVCLVAAGGGGGTYDVNNSVALNNGTNSTSGNNGVDGTGGNGGTSGGGGTTRSIYTGGGGGFTGNGGSGTGLANSGGLSFINGGTGGSTTALSSGGFGGGGGTEGGGASGRGGGGGGYSGGGAGGSGLQGGGGGGSFPSGATYIGTNTGDGYVIITAA